MIDFSTLEKALVTLESALVPSAHTELERDGVIQRFEYCFELSWKVAKRVLEESGVTTATTPKSVIRELGNRGWIKSVEQWFDFLNARNASAHTYVNKTAQEVFLKARQFPNECRALIQELKKQ
jgi:nucleotidyltransferase substrate binding protein (TIGR01987 family)